MYQLIECFEIKKKYQIAFFCRIPGTFIHGLRYASQENYRLVNSILIEVLGLVDIDLVDT